MYHLVDTLQDDKTFCKIDITYGLPNYPQDELQLADNLVDMDPDLVCQDCLDALDKQLRQGFKLLRAAWRKEGERRRIEETRLKQIQEDYAAIKNTTNRSN